REGICRKSEGIVQQRRLVVVRWRRFAGNARASAEKAKALFNNALPLFSDRAPFACNARPAADTAKALFNNVFPLLSDGDVLPATRGHLQKKRGHCWSMPSRCRPM